MNEGENFIEGFAWPLPSGFIESLGKCRFERGEILYDSPDGYLQWDEAKKRLKFHFQILSPSGAAGLTIKDEESVFAEHWKSDVEFELNDYATGKVRKIKTTQGKLYTFLWKGKWDVLESNEHPAIPLTCFDCKAPPIEVAETAKKLITAGMQKPNVFVMVFDPTHVISRSKYADVKERLNREFKVVEQIFKPNELGFPNPLIVPTMRVAAFAIDLGASAKISDALKQVLYKPSANKITDKDRFRLSAHGMFLPYHQVHSGDVVTVSFLHGEIFYRYRFTKSKIAKVPVELCGFLESLPLDCPNHFFMQPPTCSKLKLEVGIELIRERTHKIIDMAGEGFNSQRYKTAHENVETHFLEHDAATIAIEVPVWAEWEELGEYSKHIKPSGTLTGHIDLLRYADGFIEIWDYKPQAYAEKFAALQVFYYAVLLSKRTGIPLSKIKCGYFDPSDAYVFDPVTAATVVAR